MSAPISAARSAAHLSGTAAANDVAIDLPDAGVLNEEGHAG